MIPSTPSPYEIAASQTPPWGYHPNSEKVPSAGFEYDFARTIRIQKDEELSTQACWLVASLLGYGQFRSHLSTAWPLYARALIEPI